MAFFRRTRNEPQDMDDCRELSDLGDNPDA